MFNVHFRTESEEKLKEALAALEQYRVEMIAGEDDPFIDALFYLSRISTKLDNLGQLRHVYKLEQRMMELNRDLKPISAYYSILLEEKLFERHLRELYFKKCVEDYGFRIAIRYQMMTEEAILEAFEKEKTRLQSQE